MIPSLRSSDSFRTTFWYALLKWSPTHTIAFKFCFCFLFQDLLHELDDIPVDIVKEATKEVKILNDFTIRQAQKSVIQQNRFELMKKQLKFHFTQKKVRRKGRRSPSPFQSKK